MIRRRGINCLRQIRQPHRYFGGFVVQNIVNSRYASFNRESRCTGGGDAEEQPNSGILSKDRELALSNHFQHDATETKRRGSKAAKSFSIRRAGLAQALLCYSQCRAAVAEFVMNHGTSIRTVAETSVSVFANRLARLA